MKAVSFSLDKVKDIALCNSSLFPKYGGGRGQPSVFISYSSLE